VRDDLERYGRPATPERARAPQAPWGFGSERRELEGRIYSEQGRATLAAYRIHLLKQLTRLLREADSHVLQEIMDDVREATSDLELELARARLEDWIRGSRAVMKEYENGG
jgi:hypothetical protein